MIFKKRSSFFNQSLIMIISNLTTGVFGFIFSIILSQKLGAEGMGLYGLIMPIYDLFICLINGGLIAAISKTCAVYLGENDTDNLHKTIKSTLIFDCIWAIIIVILVFFNAPFISRNIIKDIRSLNPLRIICPAMLFIALSAVLKGYFLGISKAKIPASIDIVEKFFRIVIFLFIIDFFCISTIKNTVTCAFITLTLGELISLIILYIFYTKSKNNFTYGLHKKEDSIQLIFNVLVVSIPLCINSFVTSALYTISALIIPRRLIKAGLSYKTALSLLGKFSTMSVTITLFPVIILGSICTILIPNLSESMSKKDYFLAEKRVTSVIKIALMLSFATFAICYTIPKELGVMFYKRGDLGNYIKFLSLTLPLQYVSIIGYPILNGINEQKVLLKNSIIVSLEEVFCLFILTSIPCINIYGYGITLIITSITGIILNFKKILERLYINIKITDILTYVLSSILVIIILTALKNNFLFLPFIMKNIVIILSGFLIMFLIGNLN